jgi:tetratricopeptide (TPR) repeat protein
LELGNQRFQHDDFLSAKRHYQNASKLALQSPSVMKKHYDSLALANTGIIEFYCGNYEDAKQLLADSLLQRKQCAEVTEESKLLLPTALGKASLTVTIKKDLAFQHMSNLHSSICYDLVEYHTDNTDVLTADLLSSLAACYEIIENYREAKKFYDEALLLKEVIILFSC